MSKEAAMASLTGTPAPAAAVTPATETSAAAAKPESDRFAHLAKREAHLVNRDKDLKERELKAKALLDKGELFEATRKKNPVEALKLIGFTETDILNYLAEQDSVPDPTPEEKAAAGLKRRTIGEIPSLCRSGVRNLTFSGARRRNFSREQPRA